MEWLATMHVKGSEFLLLKRTGASGLFVFINVYEIPKYAVYSMHFWLLSLFCCKVNKMLAYFFRLKMMS